MLESKWKDGQGLCFFCERPRIGYFMVEITGKTRSDEPLILCVDCFGNGLKFKNMHNKKKVYTFNYEEFFWKDGKIYNEQEFRKFLNE